MLFPGYRETLAFAQGLTILNQATALIEPFRLNREQRKILRAILRNRRRVVIGKGRQVGASTVGALVLMLLALCNDGLPMAIVADKQENADDILAKIRHWLSELGVALGKDDVKRLGLPNGSRIDARTAISPAEEGESRVGRSGSYGVILATEQSYWRNARAVWASMTSTMLASGLIINESTGAPGDNLFRSVFEKSEGWERLFFGIEDHEVYREAPNLISDERWEELQALYGFTRRDSASWWNNKLSDDLGGDVSRMLREFPVTPLHMFLFREGLHISRWTEAPVIVDGDWEYYIAPKETADGARWDEPVVLGVDTSAGLGADASALALIGHRTGKPLATWRNATTPIPQFISHCHAAVRRFVPIAVVVESNAVGQAVWSALQGHKGAEEQRSGNTDGEVVSRRDELRTAIESGEVKVGGHLKLEVQSSAIKAKRSADGRVRIAFTGMDDVLSAVSFARKWRDANPWRQSAQPVPAGHLDLTALLDRKQNKRVTW